jgi:hypothetical protein
MLEDSLSDSENGSGEVDAPEKLKDQKKKLKKLELMMETGVVILATLNALNLVVVARPDLLSAGTQPLGAALAIYVTFYAALSLFLCVQAIGALKPRLSGPVQEFPDTEGVAYSRSGELLAIDALSRQSADAYYELWQKAQYRQLNREVAIRIQVLARIIILKYRALDRLYAGLLILVFLTGFLIVALTYLRFTV